MPRQRIKLQKVADLAQVSRMTASRALRNEACVAEATRQRVAAAAEKLGYRVDEQISDLMRRVRSSQEETYCETLVYVLTHPSWLAEEESRAVAEAALEQGYRMEVMRAWDYPTPEALARVLQARGIRGFILAPNKVESHFDFEGHWQDFCIVLSGSSLNNRGLPRVRPAYFQSARLLMDRLGAMGYRKVAMMVDRSMDDRTGNAYSAAFKVANHPRKNWSDKALYLKTSPDDTGWQPWFRQLQPDVLVIQSARDVHTVEDVVGRVPEDLSVVSLNAIHATRNLTGIIPQYREIAHTAVRVLTSHLRAGRMGLSETAPTISLPGLWHEGETAVQRGQTQSIKNGHL